MSFRHNSIVEIETENTEFEIGASDEALEIAATLGKENAYTLGACTGLSICPE